MPPAATSCIREPESPREAHEEHTVRTIGRAIAITCPACGIGEVAAQCWYTPAVESTTPGAGPGVETLRCDTCGIWVRDGAVLSRGVDLDVDDVRETARFRAGEDTPIEELYLPPDARPVRLIPTGVYGAASGVPWTAIGPISSVTFHLARRRPGAPER